MWYVIKVLTLFSCMLRNMTAQKYVFYYVNNISNCNLIFAWPLFNFYLLDRKHVQGSTKKKKLLTAFTNTINVTILQRLDKYVLIIKIMPSYSYFNWRIVYQLT